MEDEAGILTFALFGFPAELRSDRLVEFDAECLEALVGVRVLQQRAEPAQVARQIAPHRVVGFAAERLHDIHDVGGWDQACARLENENETKVG